MAIWGAVVEFNWFDFAVVILIGLYTWQGWERGLYLVIPECISWMAAWLSGIWLSEQLAIFMVVNFGLWPQSSWLWAFILIVVVVQQVVYRALMLVFAKLPRQYFSTFPQLLLGLVPAFLSGVMVIWFMVLVLIKIPVQYPLKTDITESWFGSRVEAQVLKWYQELVGGVLYHRL